MKQGSYLPSLKNTHLPLRLHKVPGPIFLQILGPGGRVISPRGEEGGVLKSFNDGESILKLKQDIIFYNIYSIFYLFI